MKTLRFLCFASLLAFLILVLGICLGGGGHIGLADEADSVGIPTPTEEKICKAPLALRLVSGTADAGGSAGVNSTSKPPTPVDRAGSTAPENLRSSGTIMITMTGIVGDPGDIGQGK